MIEQLQEHADSLIQEVLFRWRGMSIHAVTTLGSDGKRYLTMRPVDAGDAVHTTVGASATWTISEAVEDHSDAGASTEKTAVPTYVGVAPAAIENGTCGSCGRGLNQKTLCFNCLVKMLEHDKPMKF